MEPISGMITDAIHSPSAVADAEAPSKVQQSGDKTQGSPTAPARDEYIPEEKQEPSGRYWLGKDEDGQPKVYFDDPEKKASAGKAESCTGNTDKVDREIEKLKKKQEELERQINSETDDTKLKELEKRLAQIERELSQKDNDTYRRQHATFRSLSS